MFPPTSAPTVVLDAFCGIGGNSIQFALSPQVSKVIAVDRSADAIACARHNAAIYNVAHKIEFVCADVFALIDTRLKFETIGAVFLSPPWGGPKYRGDHVFDLEKMEPYAAGYIVRRAREVSMNLALYVPRTSDMNQLAALAEGEEMEVVHYCLARKSKVGSRCLVGGVEGVVLIACCRRSRRTLASLIWLLGRRGRIIRCGRDYTLW